MQIVRMRTQMQPITPRPTMIGRPMQARTKVLHLRPREKLIAASRTSNSMDRASRSMAQTTRQQMLHTRTRCIQIIRARTTTAPVRLTPAKAMRPAGWGGGVNPIHESLLKAGAVALAFFFPRVFALSTILWEIMPATPRRKPECFHPGSESSWERWSLSYWATVSWPECS